MSKTQSRWRAPRNPNMRHGRLTVALSHAMISDVGEYRLAQLTPEEADKQYPPQFPEHLCNPAAYEFYAARDLPRFKEGGPYEVGLQDGEVAAVLTPPRIVDLDAAAVEPQCVAVTIDAGGA